MEEREFQKRSRTSTENVTLMLTTAKGRSSSINLNNRSDRKTTSSDEIVISKSKMESYPYSLHLSSYRTLERAKRAVLIYNKKGLSPYWVKVDLKEKGIWFRVFAGHFRSQLEADKFKQKNNLSKSNVKKIRYANIIGIYSSEDDIKTEIISLKKLGYFPYFIKDYNENYPLFVGAFLTRAGAEKQYQDLQSNGVHNKVIAR